MSKIYYTVDAKHQVSDEEFSEILAGQEFLNQFMKDNENKITFHKYTWMPKGKKKLPDVLEDPDDPKAQLYLIKMLCSGSSVDALEKKYQIKILDGGSLEADENEKYSVSGYTNIGRGYCNHMGNLDSLLVYSFLLWVSKKLSDIEIRVYDEDLFSEEVPFWFTLKNGDLEADWDKFQAIRQGFVYTFSEERKQMDIYGSLLGSGKYFVDKPLGNDRDDKILSGSDALNLGWKRSLSELSRLYCSDFSEWLSKQKLPRMNGFYFINLGKYFFSISESLIKKA